MVCKHCEKKNLDLELVKAIPLLKKSITKVSKYSRNIEIRNDTNEEMLSSLIPDDTRVDTLIYLINITND